MDPIAKIQTVVAGVKSDVETLATASEALQSAVETLRERGEQPGFRAIVPAAFEDEMALPPAPRVPAKPKRPSTPARYWPSTASRRGFWPAAKALFP